MAKKKETTSPIIPTSPLFYDKITDTLMYFTPDVTLKFVVRLARADKDGFRRAYHREVQINSDKYEDIDTVYSISRSYDYFYTINDRNDPDQSIMITPSNIYLLYIRLREVASLLLGDNCVFTGDPADNTLEINDKINWSRMLFFQSRTSSKYLEFEPCVINDQNGQFYGVRMYMNSPSNYIEMDMYTFYRFYWTITKTDMHSTAVGMLNYVKSQPYGLNLVMMDEFNNYSSGNGSFFDKL